MARPLRPGELQEWQLRDLETLRSALARCVKQNAHREPEPACENRKRLLPPIRPQVRHPRIHMISGGRGTGKTSLMLTLAAEWRRVRFEKKNADVLEGWDDVLRDLYIVRGLDFDPLPAGTPLYAWLMLALKGEFSNARTTSNALSWNDDVDAASVHKPLRRLWQEVYHSAVGGWSARGHAFEAKTMEDRVLAEAEQAARWRKLEGDWAEFVGALVEELVAERQITKNGLLVIPVDDVDMRPSGARDLLMAMRGLWHPNVLFLVTGEERQLENVLAVELARELTGGGLAAESEVKSWIPHNPETGRFAGHPAELAQEQVRKAIPREQITTMTLLTDQQVLESTLQLGGEGEPVSLRARLEKVGLGEFAEAVTQYQDMLSESQTHTVRVVESAHQLVASDVQQFTPDTRRQMARRLVHALAGPSVHPSPDSFLVQVEPASPFPPLPGLGKLAFSLLTPGGEAKAIKSPWELAFLDTQASARLARRAASFRPEPSPLISWAGGQPSWLQSPTLFLEEMRNLRGNVASALGEANERVRSQMSYLMNLARTWIEVTVMESMHEEIGWDLKTPVALSIAAPGSGLPVPVRDHVYNSWSLWEVDRRDIPGTIRDSVEWRPPRSDMGLLERKLLSLLHSGSWWWSNALKREIARSATTEPDSAGLGLMLRMSVPGNPNAPSPLSTAISRYLTTSSQSTFSPRMSEEQGPGYRFANVWHAWGMVCDAVMSVGTTQSSPNAEPHDSQIYLDTHNRGSVFVLDSSGDYVVREGTLNALDWPAAIRSNGTDHLPWEPARRDLMQNHPDGEPSRATLAIESVAGHFAAAAQGLAATRGELAAQRIGLEHIARSRKMLAQSFPIPPLLGITQVWWMRELSDAAVAHVEQAITSDLERRSWVLIQLLEATHSLRYRSNPLPDNAWKGAVGNESWARMAYYSKFHVKERLSGWPTKGIHVELSSAVTDAWHQWADSLDQAMEELWEDHGSGDRDASGWFSTPYRARLLLLRALHSCSPSKISELFARMAASIDVNGCTIDTQKLEMSRDIEGDISRLTELRSRGIVDRRSYSMLENALTKCKDAELSKWEALVLPEE